MAPFLKRVTRHWARRPVGLASPIGSKSKAWWAWEDLNLRPSRLSSARSNQLSYRPEAHDLEDTLVARPKTLSVGPLKAPIRIGRCRRDLSAFARKLERETKTAGFRMSKPDWLLLFQANSIQDQRSRGEFYLEKGGDPAAGSPTATLLRLHPSR